MGYRVNQDTGEVLSFEGQRYPDDPAAVMYVEQGDEILRAVGDVSRLVYNGSNVIARSEAEQAEIDKRSATDTQIAETIAEASRRRQTVTDAIGPGGFADFLSLTARALASVRRESKGRPKPGEVDRLDALEAIAEQIEAIDKARDALISVIKVSADPGAIDPTDDAHWPT